MKTNRSLPCWTAYLDIYGFSHEIRATSRKKILKALKAVEEYLSTNQKKWTSYYMFSDSLILIQDTRTKTRSSYDALINSVKDLQNHVLENELILRGSLAYGTMTIGSNICFGDPLIRAHSVEQNLLLPLVVVPRQELKNAKISTPMPTLEVETKNGLLAATVLKPNEDLLEQVVSGRLDQTLLKGPDHIARIWALTHKFYFSKGAG